MRVLLSKSSKRELLRYLMERNKSFSVKELSQKINVSFGTLQDWIYNEERYIPEEQIPNEVLNKLKILDKKTDSWGNIKGGKKTYSVIIKKYGLQEIRRRQSLGGKKASIKRVEDYNSLSINLKNPIFLEFYGILLGDGWIGKYKFKNKTINLIGISGHYDLDRNFFSYCKKNIKILFNRRAYLKERPEQNSIELNFCHETLLNYFNKNLNFPIGKKVNLEINKKVIFLGYDSLKHVIRGVFDTDGSFYLDKMTNGNPYPCISLDMKSPLLLKQIHTILLNQGFKAMYQDKKGGSSRVILKGRKQLNKWMEEIGSSNNKHLNRINALVAQSG